MKARKRSTNLLVLLLLLMLIHAHPSIQKQEPVVKRLKLFLVELARKH